MEIRRYQPHVVARTSVEAPFARAGNEEFRRLAGSIFDANDADQKIEMTTPVAQEPDHGVDSPERFWVAFNMPRKLSLDALPAPSDSRIEVTEVPARYMPVLRYRGGWAEDLYQRCESELRSVLRDSDTWAGGGGASWARYNPPAMPWFMRTNEIAIEVVPVGGRSRNENQIECKGPATGNIACTLLRSVAWDFSTPPCAPDRVAL